MYKGNEGLNSVILQTTIIFGYSFDIAIDQKFRLARNDVSCVGLRFRCYGNAIQQTCS